LFPIGGGGGLGSKNKVDIKDKFDLKKLKPIVRKAINIVQNGG